jgi:hypothetical protein
MFTVPVLPATGHVGGIDQFLGTEAGSGWLGKLADAFPHTRYWRDRSDCWSLKSLNALAARIIDAHYDGDNVEDAMEAEFPPVEFWQTWHHEVARPVRDALADAGIPCDPDDSLDRIREGWEEAACERDDSGVADLFASYDRCELLFRFTRERWLDDSLIYSHRPWPDAGELVVDRNLQFALANLGYTMTEFRNLSRNRHDAREPLLPGIRRRRPPIVAPEQLVELIDNACSTSFLFCLYAIVPVPDLIALDLAKPVTFKTCWVASLDPINGTFHDVSASGPVTVAPGDGRFLSGGHLHWSPENICGLHTPYYHASVRN